METGIKSWENYKSTDKQLYDYLLQGKRVQLEALNAALMETQVNKEPLSNILVRNGFITQNEIIDVMINIEPEYLVDEEVIIPTIDPQLLRKLQVMIHALTTKIVYMATLKSESEVRDNLRKYFPEHEISFIPCNPERLDTYLEKSNSIYHDEGSLVEKIIRKAIQNGVSDIHIMPHYDTYSILYRYLGVRYVKLLVIKKNIYLLLLELKT